MNASDRRAVVAVWIAVAALIGYLDYVTGPSVSLTLFYLVPVVGAAWFGGRVAGVAVALLAGIASLLSDLLLGTGTTGATLYWNTTSRTVVLGIAAVVVNRIQVDRRALAAADAQRTRSLQLLDRGLAGPAKEILELLDHWDGSIDQLRTMLRPRAEAITYLARDFTEMVRLQRGQLPVMRSKVDLLGLVEDLRTEEARARRVTLIGPSERLLVLADGARVRQSFHALLGLVGRGDELFLSLARRERAAEIVMSSDGTPAQGDPSPGETEELSLSVELARLMLVAQGGSLDVLRNPITRSLRVTARLPLA